MDRPCQSHIANEGPSGSVPVFLRILCALWSLRLLPSRFLQRGSRCRIEVAAHSRALNGSVDRRVARASTQIPCKADADLVERRLPSERHGGHDHARRADPALRAAVRDEGALQRMAAAEPLDRRHARALDVRHRHEARVHRRAVDEDGAGAALAFAAPFLRSRERAVFAQKIQQTPEWMRRDLDSSSVEDQRHAMIFSGVAGISRTSKPACRSALITAGAGPSIGISPTPFAPNGPCLYGLPCMTTRIGGVSSVVGMM